MIRFPVNKAGDLPKALAPPKEGNRMAVQVTNLHNDRIIEVATTGKLTRADYDEFVPVIESAMKQGKVKILFSMTFLDGPSVHCGKILNLI